MKKLKELWLKFKTWVLQKALPWLKAWAFKNWFMIINYFVIVMAYNILYGKPDVVFAELLLGLWIFASIGYAGYKWFMKKDIMKEKK